MYLLRQHAKVFAGKLTQREHVAIAAARVGGDDVIGQVLFFAKPLVDCLKALLKRQQAVGAGFSHLPQHRGLRMLRSKLQLTRDVVPDQFFHVTRAVFRIRHHQIMPDTRANKDLTHAFHLPHGFQQAGMRGMREAEQRANLRVDAALILAGAAVRLNMALKTVHVGCRAGKIVNNAPKTRAVPHRARFRQDACLGAPGDPPTFMHGNRTEVAFAVAAAVRRDGKLDGFQGAHFALRRVIGMHGILKGQRVNRVHLFSGQGWRRRILHHITVPVALRQTARADWVVIIVEHVKHLDEAVIIRANLFV